MHASWYLSPDASQENQSPYSACDGIVSEDGFYSGLKLHWFVVKFSSCSLYPHISAEPGHMQTLQSGEVVNLEASSWNPVRRNTNCDWTSHQLLPSSYWNLAMFPTWPKIQSQNNFEFSRKHEFQILLSIDPQFTHGVTFLADFPEF